MRLFMCIMAASVFCASSPFNISPPPCSSSSPFSPHQIHTLGCTMSSDWLWLNSKMQGLDLIGRRLEAGGGGAEGIAGKRRREMRFFFFFLKDVNGHLSQSAITRLWVQKSRSESERSGLWHQDNAWILMTCSLFLIFFGSLVDHLCGRLSLKEMDWGFSVSAFAG